MTESDIGKTHYGGNLMLKMQDDGTGKILLGTGHIILQPMPLGTVG